MKLTKCENKHFYDSDKYDICPHCEKEMGAANVAAFVPKMDKPGMGFDTPNAPKKTDTLSPHTSSIWEQGEDKKTASFMDEFANHDNVHESEVAAPMFCGKCGAELRKNTPFCGVCGFKANHQAFVKNYPREESVEQNNISVEDNVTQLMLDTTTVADSAGTTAPTILQNSLQSQVNAVASHVSTEDVKTMAFYDFADTEPVVGWLVCIKGEYFGQSFNLKAGQNFIGRALNMDVPLAKDTSVSRNKHAIITYDPQNRVFFIQPGESNGLTYLNGSLLLAHSQINAYEKIKVGNSELIFVPCCGTQFTWEDYLQ